MMNVLVMNESTGKSFQKAKSIISKYLTQLGQKTYSGSISLEGLETLFAELKLNSSKYMSISCIEQKNNHKNNLLWIVGNKNNFNPESGEYSVASKKLTFENRGFSEQEKYWKLITEISALLHDIGKCNDDFQNKLYSIMQFEEKKKKNNGKEAEEMLENFEIFRHEAVSAIIFNEFITKYIELNNDDANKSSSIEKIFNNILDKLQEKDDKSFNFLLDKYNALLEKTHEKISKLYLTNENETKKVGKFKKIQIEEKELSYFEKSLVGILWVVLTHHRLIETSYMKDGKKLFVDNITSLHDSKNKSTFCNLNFDDYGFNEDKKKQKLRDNFTFNANGCFKNEDWLKSITVKLKNLKSICDTNIKIKSSKEYISILAHYARPTMILGDYVASITKSKKDNKLNLTGIVKKGNICIANLHMNKEGDTVSTHLKKVAKSAKSIQIYRKNVQINKDQNKVENFQLKKLLDTMENSDAKYQWQNNAYQKIKIETEGQNFGNLVMIISETGSGKTIGGAKIMHALQKDGLRFTLGLGLRTLTLQSGHEYRKALGLDDEKIAVVLGSTLMKKMDNTGSDILKEKEDLIIDVKDNGFSKSWIDTLTTNDDLNDLKTINSGNISKLVDTPIVVSTVDQFIKIINFSKPSSLKLLARVFSSDLILDEIDSYSPGDLVEILKLIHYYAFFGRNVVIMSATVNKNILEEIKKVYETGFNCYKILNEYEKNMKCFMVSNLIDTDEIKDNNDINSYLNNFTKKQEGDSFKAKLKVGNIINIENESLDNWKKIIYEEAKKLHNKYKSDDGISIGFVKFNTVSNARNFASYLLSESDENLDINNEFKISVLCYHSKYTPIELQNIESDLSKIVNRKNKNDKNRLEKINELKQKLYKHNEAKDIMILISTTSILEVGRDHDYDFAIIEPSTNRALIQSAGRVLRHRTGDKEGRISVISKMLKIINDKTKTSDIWKNIGVFNYLTEYEINQRLVDFRDMFGNVYDNRIISSEMFKKVSNEMRYLEDKVFERKFNDLLLNTLNMKILNSSEYKNYFRKNNMVNETNIQLINLNTRNNQLRFDNKMNDFTQIYIRGKGCDFENFTYKEERVFLKFNIKTFNQKYVNKLRLNEQEILELYNYQLKTFSENPDISYHFLLGFNYKFIERK